MKEQTNQYYAFISYNGGDTKYAKRIKSILERFWIPSYIKRDDEKQEDENKKIIIYDKFFSKYFLTPIFRDKDNIVGADPLKDKLLTPNLDSSHYLVVLCSSNVRKSGWVGPDEVQHFIDTNRSDDIIPFVINGDGNILEKDDSNCIYPEELRELLYKKKKNDPKNQTLYISVEDQDVGWVSMIPWPSLVYRVKFYKAGIRIAAKILGETNFDNLWKSNLRLLRNTSLLLVLLFYILYFFFFPVDMTISVNDDSHHLPTLTEAVIIVNDNKEIEYRINKADTTLHIGGLPGYCRYKSIFSSIPVKFRSEKYYEDIDCQVSVYSNKNIIQLKRDSTFALYDGFIIDGHRNPISNVSVIIGDDENGYQEVLSDTNGYFRIVFPIEKQTENKLIKLSKSGLNPKEAIIEPTIKKDNKEQYLMSNI